MKYPDDYPFIAPCPGCFENFLTDLWRQGDNTLFVSNGDFTCFRFAKAFGKIFPGCHVRLGVFLLESETLDKPGILLDNKSLSSVDIFYKIADDSLRDKSVRSDIRLHQVDTLSFFIQAEKDDKPLMTIQGFMQQRIPSRSVELFTLIANQEQQNHIRRVFTRMALNKHL